MKLAMKRADIQRSNLAALSGFSTDVCAPSHSAARSITHRAYPGDGSAQRGRIDVVDEQVDAQIGIGPGRAVAVQIGVALLASTSSHMNALPVHSRLWRLRTS